MRSEALVTLIETAGTYKLRIFNMNTCQGKKNLTVLTTENKKSEHVQINKLSCAVKNLRVPGTLKWYTTVEIYAEVNIFTVREFIP